MIDDLHIELLQMLEKAGRNLVRLVLDLARLTSGMTVGETPPSKRRLAGLTSERSIATMEA